MELTSLLSSGERLFRDIRMRRLYLFASQQSNISHIKWLSVCDLVTDLGRLHPATQLRVHSSGINAACHSDFYLIDHNRDGFCGMVVGNSWGTCSARSCRPKWEHAWLTDSFGLERNSRAQSIANGIHLQRWNLSQHYRMSMVRRWFR
jgi:hypothetical protein